MNNSIKEQLIDAGRYERINKILIGIMGNKDPEPPVKAYVNDNDITMWRIDGIKLASEAKDLYGKICDNKSTTDLTIDDYLNLLHFVETQADMLLHNYANSIMHRHKPKTKPGKIRSYLILDNMLFCLGGDWKIPDGWKRKNKK